MLKKMATKHRRVSELEKEKRLQAEIEQEKVQIAHTLGERVKELNCLYGVSELIEAHGGSIDTLLQGVADLLPVSWQYPQITCARVVHDGQEYRTSTFKTSIWKQAAGIVVAGKKVGRVEVYYLKKMPGIDEGPFLKEERLLIDAVAERIGRALERIEAEQQLDVERAALKNMNIALHEVLAKVQDEKKEIGDAIQANVDKIILPILHALEIDLPPKQRGYVMLLKGNLAEISSPFTNTLSKQFMILTPTEIQICNMIKKGFSTKEIAKIRHLSPATVSRHREYIRKKLGLANKNVNLTTYLHTFLSE